MTGDVVLGLLRTGGLDVALPLSALREVVPCPEELVDVPATAVGLLGVMTLRTTIVPVVDLVHLLGRPHERSRGQVVVVVAHEGQVIGLLVDEVRGLATVPRTALVEVTCRGGGLLSSRTFHHPEQGHVVSLLDEAALLSVPGLPVARLQDPEPVSVTASVGRSARSLTVVRCGAFTLALDVAFVHSTIPTPQLRRSAVDGPTCLGMTEVAGYDVGVVDLLALLGLGALAGTPLDCGLVLDLPGGQVVLGVSAMIGLHDVPAELVVRLPAVASPSPDLLPAVADVPGVGATLLLDGERLRACADVVSMSRVATETDQGVVSDGATAVHAPPVGPPHLAYRAGVDLATELSQVAEVLAHPRDLVPSSGAPGVLGFVVHRGQAVPVLSLAEEIGREAEPPTEMSRLLLLDVDDEPVAYAVSGLHAILRPVWADPAPSGADRANVLRACPLVQLDTMTSLLPVLDLVAVTRARRNPPAVEVEVEDGAELLAG